MFSGIKGSKRALLALVFAAATGLAGNALAQESAEVTFWNSIKDSKNAAEYQAYLQAFPNGIFAPLARLRVQQLGSTGGPAPAPAGRQPAQAPPRQPSNPAAGTIDMSNMQIVAEIQSKLYNLNYDVKRFDGTMDDSTRDAIREWQERIEVTATGELTDAQLQRLRNSRPPRSWAAVAYTANGTIGRTWSRPSRKDAEDTALEECRRRAGRNADCTMQSAGDTACVAVATYRATVGETVYYGGRSSLKPNLQEAITAAMDQCQRAERSNGTCASRTAVCGDGSHERQ